MTSDLINGLFEVFSGMLTVLSVRRLYRDKSVRGISIYPILFFTLWGGWNLYFYPVHNLYLSFSGGIIMFTVNAIWVSQMIYYRKNK